MVTPEANAKLPPTPPIANVTPAVAAVQLFGNPLDWVAVCRR